jgi:O-antigen/teichoic acid export membrane protein
MTTRRFVTAPQTDGPSPSPHPDPLRTKVLKGGFWLLTSRAVSRVFGLIRIIILARILAPEDFGIIGVAMMSIAILATFSQTGFEAALVQKKNNIASYLDSAWTISAARGCLLFLILFFSAPVIGAFFQLPQALAVIRTLSVNTLFSGFRSIKLVILKRELAFGKQFLYEFVAMAVDIIVSVAMALYLRNYWALVWGGLAANFTRLVMSYLLCPYSPRIRFDRHQLRELFGFGRWVLFSNLLVFAITQGDDLFVAKFLGVTALGMYQLAFMISNLPATEISHVISHVTFPAYAQLQDDRNRLREAYLKVLRLTALLSLPLAAGIYILAEESIALILGTKWLPAVPAVEVLVFAGCIRSIAATTGPVFRAVGQPKIDTFWQVIRFTVLIGLIYPFTQLWGIAGAAASVLLSISISTIGFSAMTARVIDCRYRQLVGTIAVPASCSLGMMTVLGFLKMVWPVLQLPHLAGLILSGIFVYFGLALLLSKPVRREISEILTASMKGRYVPPPNRSVSNHGNGF